MNPYLRIKRIRGHIRPLMKFGITAVIPAKAGLQRLQAFEKTLDARLTSRTAVESRGNDGQARNVQTFLDSVSGPEPGTDAIESLHRVGRQQQFGRSHASDRHRRRADQAAPYPRADSRHACPLPCRQRQYSRTPAGDRRQLEASRRKPPALRAPGWSLARRYRCAGAPPAAGSSAPRRRDRRSRGPQRAPSAWCLPPSRRPTPRPATAGALKRSEPGTDRKTTSKSVGQANLVPHGHAALRTTGPAPAACPEVRPARAPTPAPARSSRRARRTHR